MDPVKIDSLSQFGTPKEVGKKVMGVEVSHPDTRCADAASHNESMFPLSILLYTASPSTFSQQESSPFSFRVLSLQLSSATITELFSLRHPDP